MNLARIIPWTSRFLRLNSKEPPQKPTATREVSEATRRSLEAELSILNTETNEGKVREAEKRFLEICTEEQRKGHDIRPYWDNYRQYRNKKYY